MHHLDVITGQKATQEQPKMTASAFKKTLKNLKLENYSYNISLKLVQYVYNLKTFHFYWKLRVSLDRQQ